MKETGFDKPTPLNEKDAQELMYRLTEFREAVRNRIEFWDRLYEDIIVAGQMLLAKHPCLKFRRPKNGNS